MSTAGLLPSLHEAWIPVQQAVSTTSPLSVIQDRQTFLFLKLQTGSGSLGQFWHFHRGLQASFSAIQTLGKGLRPPTGLC